MVSPLSRQGLMACREDLDAASQEAESQACNCEVNCRSDNLSSSTSESSLCLQVYYYCMPTPHAIQSNTLLAAKTSHSWTDNICMHGPRLDLHEITAYTFAFWGCQPLKLALTQSHMYMTHTDLCLPLLLSVPDSNLPFKRCQIVHDTSIICLWHRLLVSP